MYAFSFYPHFAACEELFLPDRNGAFKLSYSPLAGLKGSAAMRSTNSDYYTCFADLRTPRTMNDTYVRNAGEAFMRLAS